MSLHALIPLVAVATLLGAPASAFAQVTAPTAQLSPLQAAVLTGVARVCLPLIDGVDLASVRRSSGLQHRQGVDMLPLEGGRRVVVAPPGGASPAVCSLAITHAVDAQDSIRQVLDAWALSQNPRLTKLKDRVEQRGPYRVRKVTTWAGATPTGALALVLSEEKLLDGRPAGGTNDEATVLVSVAPD